MTQEKVNQLQKENIEFNKTKTQCEKMYKKLYLGLRIILGVLGITVLFNIIPNLTNTLQLLIPLYNLTDKTPEFKLLLLCISIWVNCVVITTIVNIVFKLHSLLEDKLIKKNQKHQEKK